MIYTVGEVNRALKAQGLPIVRTPKGAIRNRYIVMAGTLEGAWGKVQVTQTMKEAREYERRWSDILV